MAAPGGDTEGLAVAYAAGVDLGTTYTSAALSRDGRSEMVSLGTRSTVVPSVLYLGEEGGLLVGEAAHRRAVTEPDRVAREFKRRVGDTTPLILGGTPLSVVALTARLLEWVVGRVIEQEGGDPSHLVVTRPANWGPYKQSVLDDAVRLANLPFPTSTVTEPEAAAAHYASVERVAPGDVVAVYDLGGGTFDAAVLRKTDAGFDVLGEPEGVERLGGIDVDEAVLAHLRRSLGEALTRLDSRDPATAAAAARVRAECVDAKEALSADTTTSIAVVLPSVHTEVLLTRAELEAMVRPMLADTVSALRRALRSAGIDAGDLRAVLLVGGSSRMPLVGQLVTAELGRPVAVDVHPKHAVALGAALVAERRATAPIPVASTEEEMPDVGPTPPPPLAAPAHRRGRARLVAGAIAAVAVIAGVVAFLLTTDDGDTPTAGTTATTGSTEPGSGTTGLTLAEALRDAQTASDFLVRAWEAGDRTAALAVAETVAVDKLFGLTYPDPEPVLASCASLGEDVGCQYDLPSSDPSGPSLNGAIGIRTTETSDESRVVDIEMFPYDACVAADFLLGAWSVDSRTTALLVADQVAVDELFLSPYPASDEPTFDSSTSSGSEQDDCHYRSGASVYVIRAAASGEGSFECRECQVYRVTDVGVTAG